MSMMKVPVIPVNSPVPEPAVLSGQCPREYFDRHITRYALLRIAAGKHFTLRRPFKTTRQFLVNGKPT
jgi:hypothetical protein